MLGVLHIKHSRRGRGRKTTYDRYEVGLKAVEVQGVPGRELVVRGSGRARHRYCGEASQDRLPVPPMWSPGKDRAHHEAAALARRTPVRADRLAALLPARNPLSHADASKIPPGRSRTPGSPTVSNTSCSDSRKNPEMDHRRAPPRLPARRGAGGPEAGAKVNRFASSNFKTLKSQS